MIQELLLILLGGELIITDNLRGLRVSLFSNPCSRKERPLPTTAVGVRGQDVE